MKNRATQNRLIVSLCVGRDDLFNLVQPVQQAYAKKHGHAFLTLTEEKFRVRPNWVKKRRVGYHFEKFQVHELLKDYDQIAFLDGDVFPTVAAPDIFESITPGNWGCVAEPEGNNKPKFEQELTRMEKRLGPLPAGCRIKYFNSGVLVFDQSHSPIWEWRKREVLSGRWPEQTLLNYRVARSRIPIVYLDKRFNFTLECSSDWTDDGVRRNAYFIHYAGQQAKQYLLHDLAFLESQWGLAASGP